jgi:alkylation response protein AidB-like acyl-CoA dehydrogenase
MNEREDLAEIRRAVRALCAEFPGEYWRAKDRDRAYPGEFVDALTRAGFLAALIPEEFGGSGLKLDAASVIMEEIQASGCNGASAHAQMYIMNTLLRYGSPQQKASYLPRIASGELRLQAFGVSEPTSGTDTLSLKTRAVRDGDEYVVNGQKVWTSRAEHSDLMLLLARTTPREEAAKRTEGLSIFLVDMRKAIGNGLTIDARGVLRGFAHPGLRVDRRRREGLPLHPLRHERRAHPDRSRMRRRRQMVYREGDRLRQRASGV